MTWWLWVICALAYIAAGCVAFTMLLPHRYKIRFRKHRNLRCDSNCDHRRWEHHTHEGHFSTLEEAIEYHANEDAGITALVFAWGWPISLVGYLLRYNLTIVWWVLNICLFKPTERIALRRQERVREKEKADL